MHSNPHSGRRPVFKAEIVRGAGRPSSSSSVKRETIADSDDDGMDVSDDDQYQDDDAVRESTSEARPRVRAPAVVVDTKNLTVPKAEGMFLSQRFCLTADQNLAKIVNH